MTSLLCGREYWAAGRSIAECQSHRGQSSRAGGNDGISIGRRMSNDLVECRPNKSMYDIIIQEKFSEAFDQGNNLLSLRLTDLTSSGLITFQTPTVCPLSGRITTSTR